MEAVEVDDDDLEVVVPAKTLRVSKKRSAPHPTVDDDDKVGQGRSELICAQTESEGFELHCPFISPNSPIPLTGGRCRCHGG